MRSVIELDTERPEDLKNILQPSLESDENVEYELKTGKGKLKIDVSTEGIGPLRGCTDAVFRLSTLTTKLY